MLSVVHVDRVIVISPHLDDAVFSCGTLLAQLAAAPLRSAVLTVLAGMPPPQINLAPYDAKCGFSSSRQAMLTRWDEDSRALAGLGADVIRLGTLDSQYAPLPDPAQLADTLWSALAHRVDSTDAVLMPFGLFHCDHECVAHACRILMQRHADATRWLAYEDVLYRRRQGVLQRRLVTLHAAGIEATPITLLTPDSAPGVPLSDGDAGQVLGAASPHHLARKRRAVRCYASQLQTLSITAGGDETSAERYWLLSPCASDASVAPERP